LVLTKPLTQPSLADDGTDLFDGHRIFPIGNIARRPGGRLYETFPFGNVLGRSAAN
jgi:hypothetical protein